MKPSNTTYVCTSISINWLQSRCQIIGGWSIMHKFSGNKKHSQRKIKTEIEKLKFSIGRYCFVCTSALDMLIMYTYVYDTDSKIQSIQTNHSLKIQMWLRQDLRMNRQTNRSGLVQKKASYQWTMNTKSWSGIMLLWLIS